MDLTDVKALADKVKKLTSEARATGPKTEKGKLRAATNAVRHGLTGKNLLLPGEDPGEYEARMDNVFTALGPQSDVEAELVALVADDIHKLNRLARIELGAFLARIEELLSLTGTAEKASVTVNAINAVGTALTPWIAEPLPVEKGPEFMRRYRAMTDALDLVEATVSGAPADLMEAGHELMAQLHGKAAEKVVPPDLYQAAFDHGRRLMSLPLDMGKAEDAAQDGLRAAIAGIALPNKDELAKLAKYRSMLEISLQRRLAALDQLRILTTGNVADAGGAEKAKEYRVKLRMVT